jgi:hypothetical protein
LKTIKQFVWIGLHEFDMLLSQSLFHIFKDLSCMVLKELFANQSCMRECDFSAEVAMAEATEREVIGTEAQEGQDSPYTLMLTRKS